MKTLLSPDDVAEKLGIARRTAMELMKTMPHSVICGRERKRIRVTEDALEQWLLKRSHGVVVIGNMGTGSKKRLERR